MCKQPTEINRIRNLWLRLERVLGDQVVGAVMLWQPKEPDFILDIFPVLPWLGLEPYLDTYIEGVRLHKLVAPHSDAGTVEDNVESVTRGVMKVGNFHPTADWTWKFN